MSANYRSILQKNFMEGLADCQPGSYTDLYGFIVDFKPVKKSTKGAGDYSQSIAITDPTIQDRSINVQVFQEREEMLPQVERGRLIVFKNIYINHFNKKLQPVSKKDSTTYVTVDLKDLKTYASEDISCPLEPLDINILKGLRSFYNTPDEPKTFAAPVGRPTLQTDQLATHPSKFFDYVGMVVGCYPEETGRKTNLILTDYTVNPRPYFTDDDGLKGIRSELLLQCTLWDNHSDACPDLAFGDFVSLRNCIRNTRRNILEIAIKGNTSSKKHVVVLEENSPELAALLERKKEYVPIPPTMEDDDDNDDVESVSDMILEDEELEAEEERENLEKLQEANQEVEEEVEEEEEEISRKRKVEQLDDDGEEFVFQRSKFSPEPESTSFGAKIVPSLFDIAQNQSYGVYCAKALIADYKPKNVANWIRGFCPTCVKTFDHLFGPCGLCGKPTQLTYQFGLLLQDKKATLPVYLVGDHATFFFSDIPPEVAHQDPTKLALLQGAMEDLSAEEERTPLEFAIESFESDAGRSYRIVKTKINFFDED